MTSEAVVGLEFITEFSTGDEREAPLYHCSMEECREEQGDAETMKSHILSLRHKQSYVYSQTGSFLHTQTEIQQKVAELTSDYRRDYRQIRVQEDREAHRMIKNGRFRMIKHEADRNRNHRSRSRSRSRERKYKDVDGSYGDRQRDRKYGESSSREDEYYKRRYHDEHDRRGEERSYESGRRDRDRDRSYQGRGGGGGWDSWGRKRSPEVDRYDQERSYQRGGGGWDRKRSPDSVRYEQERSYRGSDGRRDGDRSRHDEGRERREREPEPKVERSPPPPLQSRDVLRSREEAEVSSTVTTLEEEEVKRLHNKVAETVMMTMNQYWPGAEEFIRGCQKIRTEEDYSRLAKQLSRDLREKIKDGIRLTLDHIEYIKINVESFFEKLPLVR